MKLAKATLKLNMMTTIEVVDITPAQAAYLVAEHHVKAKGIPIDLEKLVVTGEVERSPKEEVNRLCTLYPVKKVKAMFPGAVPNVPETFEEACEAGMETTLPKEALTKVDITA